MSRALLAGSLLNQIAGSMLRYPSYRVLIWNPIRNSIGDVASGRATDAPLDITAYTSGVEFEENIGYENPENPSPTRISVSFHKNPPVGTFKRGWIADGVIVRILEGDVRVRDTDWVPIFTGTFRGRPAQNNGTRADLSEGFAANALGREERYISCPPVTTPQFPAGTDLGEIAFHIAWKNMGLSAEEILFGKFGVETLHVTNQIVDENPLEGLYQCMFPAGKKPKFDGLGRLCAVDVDLDKPAARIYSAGDFLIESLVAAPNDIEVNNQVTMHGLSHVMTKVVQNAQVLDTVDLTTGFFDAFVRRRVFYSQDHSQKALDTFLVPAHGIKWSHADWTEKDEFHGQIGIDTHYLRNVRAIIFGTYLALQLAIVILDLAMDEGGTTVANAPVPTPGGGFSTLAILRAILQGAAQVAIAALIWSMNYIGRGEYEIWGSPFEFVFQELVSDNRLVGLEPEELRTYDYRNDFISTMDDLDRIGRERLRRELVKNQLYEISVLADPLLEVDDVIETSDGSRYYILTLRKSFGRGKNPTMSITAWKVYEDVLAAAHTPPVAVGGPAGYGYGYGYFYGSQL